MSALLACHPLPRHWVKVAAGRCLPEGVLRFWLACGPRYWPEREGGGLRWPQHPLLGEGGELCSPVLPASVTLTCLRGSSARLGLWPGKGRWKLCVLRKPRRMVAAQRAAVQISTSYTACSTFVRRISESMNSVGHLGSTPLRI